MRCRRWRCPANGNDSARRLDEANVCLVQYALWQQGFSPALERDYEVATRRREATRLSEEFRTLAARTHAAIAELAALAARLDAVEGWCGTGLRSFGDWASLNTGVAPRTGEQLLAVGTALRDLPSNSFRVRLRPALLRQRARARVRRDPSR